MDIRPLGNNWFDLHGSGGCLEYNTGETPLAELQNDRNPLASVYRHIEGVKVVAKIYGQLEESFFYKKYGFDGATKAAQQFVERYFFEKNSQRSIFDICD